MTLTVAAAPEVISASTTEPRRGPWVRPALWLLLAATAVLYLWGLNSGGYANQFYSAAVQAGTQSWRALLFGSLDAGNAITVDKPPAAMWVMGLSGRLFGFSTLSMLVPQALMGVGAVALLYAAVRRTSGHGAGLLAGTVLAATPVAALMFRFNNPDALLVLLLVAAGYCSVRALDRSPGRWVALAGIAMGLAFLTKLLEAFVVTPALAMMVLVAVPGSFWSRLRTLLIGVGAMLASGGWFVALVSLWPKNSRPYIGGSTDNSLLQLALGYNGVGRVLGGDGNPTGGGGPGGGGSPMFGGGAGITRMFGESTGTEISWLLPAALIGLVAGLWFTRSAPRTGRLRAGLLLWGCWLLVTALVFSFMQGIMHPYYTVALAPAVAAVVAITARELWWGRQFTSARIVLAAMGASTGVWTFILLDRTPEWLPWLRWVLLIGSIAVSFALVIGDQRLGRYTAVLAVAGLLFGLGGTAAYAVDNVAVNHAGARSSGPARPDGSHDGPRGQMTPNAGLDALLKATHNRWAAATIGSHTAGSLELSTGTSVMAIGGFSGQDNSPTLTQFQQYVTDHQVRYFVPGDGNHHRGGSDAGAAHQITEWVQANFIPQKVGDTTVYDLGQ